MIRFFHELFLIRDARDPRLPMAAWIAAAALSVTLAAGVAVQPGGLEDHWLVHEWIVHWLQHGNPYETYRNLDYPPGAFLLLWPLAFLDPAIVPIVVILLTVSACTAAAWLLIGWFADRLRVSLRWQDQATLMAILLAGSPVRAAIWRGQSTPLAFLFGALALHWSVRKPVLAAAALALCAFKPHIAVGFGLALLLMSRWRIVAIAAALVAAQWLLFAATIEHTLPQVVASYAGNLLTLYQGPERFIGLLSIRWVIEDLAGDYAIGTAIAGVLAAASLALIAAAARRRGEAMAAQVTAACLLWSLLFLPHQLYNAILAAPALWLLMWPEAGLVTTTRIRAMAVGAYIVFGVVDVPRSLRVVSRGPGEMEWVTSLSYMLSPLRIAVLFALTLSVLAWALLRDPHQLAPASGRR